MLKKVFKSISRLDTRLNLIIWFYFSWLYFFFYFSFFEGKYVKYNSNSGFVLDDEAHRQTPQAFSHLTFERSGHQLVVVDIQGVGDLYTDPQIHTASG